MKATKRIVSLALAVLMLLSCAAFVGCEGNACVPLEGYSEISVDEELVISNVARKFDYLDAFIPKFSPAEYDIIDNDSFSAKISNVNCGTHGLYKSSIKTDDHYYICGYGSEFLFALAYMTFGDSASIYEWYRVDDFDLICENVGGKKLMHIFLVRDAVIERDIVSGEVLDHATKYYDYYRGSNKNELKVRNLGDGAYLLYLKKDLVQSGEPFCISFYTLHLGYDVYIDGDGMEYLVFLNEVRDTEGKIENKSGDFFAEYYDALSQHFVAINSIGNDTLHYAGIEIGTMLEMVIK